MRPGKSRETIKHMQEFMDRLDKHVLNQKVLGSKIKVKHIVAATASYGFLAGLGGLEDAVATDEAIHHGIKALACGVAAYSMLGEKYTYDGDKNSDRTILNRMVVGATHLYASQVENGEKLYKDGKYVGTVVNRYDDQGKVISSEPIYQYREHVKESLQSTGTKMKSIADKTKDFIGKMWARKQQQHD